MELCVGCKGCSVWLCKLSGVVCQGVKDAVCC